MKELTVWIGGAVVAVLLFVAVWILGFALSWWAAPWQGKLEARREITSGASRIANYNSFFNLCASVQSNEARIDELETTVELVTDAAEKQRLTISLGGVKALRHEGIRTYNANARKDYTAGQFRDSDLPYQLTDSDYSKGERKTSCGSD